MGEIFGRVVVSHWKSAKEFFVVYVFVTWRFNRQRTTEGKSGLGEAFGLRLSFWRFSFDYTTDRGRSQNRENRKDSTLKSWRERQGLRLSS